MFSFHFCLSGSTIFLELFIDADLLDELEAVGCDALDRNIRAGVVFSVMVYLLGID
jgi:hypothetical protein